MGRIHIVSLAGLLAASAAVARDLPRSRAEPQHPDACQSYGPGFVKAEGTDTCVRLSGDVRAEVTVGGGGSGFAPGASR